MSKPYQIGIIVFDGVLTSEVIGPAEVFATAAQREWFLGSTIQLIGIEQRPLICTEEGIQLGVDATIADELTLDVLLVPGGNDVNHLLNHKQLNAFIQKQEETAEWLGSYCAGAFVLGSAGVLDGKLATTWFGGEATLQDQFPNINVVHDKPVVVDNRRITANGGLVSYQAALILLGRLTTPNHAQEIYNSLGIGRLQSWPEIESTILETTSPDGVQSHQ